MKSERHSPGTLGTCFSGAPFAYKTTNISVRALFAGNDRLQDVLAANYPGSRVIKTVMSDGAGSKSINRIAIPSIPSNLFRPG
jgi:hypothetical protein